VNNEKPRSYGLISIAAGAGEVSVQLTAGDQPANAAVLRFR
jgi:hypothetical protein